MDQSSRSVKGRSGTPKPATGTGGSPGFIVVSNGQANLESAQQNQDHFASLGDEKEECRIPNRVMNAQPGRFMKGKGVTSSGVSVPPEIATAPTVRQPIRFYTSSAASDEAITVTDILGGILVVGRVSNTSFTPIASSFRIRKITIWNAPNLGSSEVAWLASDTTRVKDEVKNAATPSGTSLPTKNVFRPPRGSVAYDWVLATTSGSVQLIRLSIPQGSIMDIDMEWTLSSGHITMSAINSISGSVTVGAYYRLYLDRASGNGYIRPLAYPSNT